MDSNDYIIAAKGQCLTNCTPEDRAESIRTAVDRAYNLKGMPRPSGVDYETIVTEVERKVVNAYPYMTSQELAWITERGVAGELTKETRPTASAIFGWMHAYMNDDLRKEAIRNYRRNASGSDTRLRTPQEISELNRQAEARALRTLWAEYKVHGRILEDEHLRGYVAMAMDGLVRRGLFSITAEHWETARREARNNRHRLLRSAFGIMAAAPDVPGSIVKWTMLEMCFSAQLATGRDLIVKA